jgi:hypothetical protein
MQQGPHSNAPTTHWWSLFQVWIDWPFCVAMSHPSTTAGVGNQVNPQGQQNFMHGKVNHMTSEEAQQAPDVVLGMFLASSHPATILFDSGASHSFIIKFCGKT